MERGFDENVGATWWVDPARGDQAGYKSESGGYVAPFKNTFREDGADNGWLSD